MYKTYSYRIKDSSCKNKLIQMSRSVNFVWNFLNDTVKSYIRFGKNPWKLNSYHFSDLTKGSSKELGVSSATLQEISSYFDDSRKRFKKPFLKYRSNSKSLGWIPFRKDVVKFNTESGSITYMRKTFKVWYDRPIQGEIVTGSFSQDSRGRWYVNITCRIEETIGPVDYRNSVGIDLGLKSLLTTSDGESIEAQKFFRKSQKLLAKAQRKRKKKLVKKIHAKVKNRRRDFNHKVSTNLTNRYSLIFVGDVQSQNIIDLEKPGMAKSVYDASWYQLKTFLSYKALAKGRRVVLVNERNSTRICNACGAFSKNSPKGEKGLSIREWTCCHCSSHNDRDINAAKNILGYGHVSLLGSLSLLGAPA